MSSVSENFWNTPEHYSTTALVSVFIQTRQNVYKCLFLTCTLLHQKDGLMWGAILVYFCKWKKIHQGKVVNHAVEWDSWFAIVFLPPPDSLPGLSPSHHETVTKGFFFFEYLKGFLRPLEKTGRDSGSIMITVGVVDLAIKWLTSGQTWSYPMQQSLRFQSYSNLTCLRMSSLL